MGPVEVTDAELATLARAGDAHAVAGLLERHRPALYAAAIGLLGNRADALDAVQDTNVVALLRIGELREAAAAKRWLHTVLRNVCLMRLRQRREVAAEHVDVADPAPSPEHLLEEHAMREWVWQAIDALDDDEKLTLMLRYFTRCTAYEAIARVTAVPVGTVRSRLHRARTQMADRLTATVAGTSLSRDSAEAQQRAQWADFYRQVHEQPVAATYGELFAPDVDVRDTVGHWTGLPEWSSHEREAIALGVRANLVGVVASNTVTVLEIDFSNPVDWPDHCPPRATFVHHVRDDRSVRLRIHYPS